MPDTNIAIENLRSIATNGPDVSRWLISDYHIVDRPVQLQLLTGSDAPLFALTAPFQRLLLVERLELTKFL